MARPVRIAAIQIPRWVEGKTAREKYEWNLRNIEACLQKAGEAGCDITGVGECSNTRSLSPAEKAQVLGPLLDGPEVEIGSRLAKAHKMNVCLGIAGIHERKKRNAAVLLDRQGKLAGVYHKVQLTRREKIAGTVPGDDFPVFELDFGKVGCLICHDMSFVEAARVLGVRGAEIILWPSNWSGWGRDLSNCLIRSRAVDNHAYVVFLSSGQNPEKAMNWNCGVLGCTSVVSPLGRVVAQMPTPAPGFLVAHVDLDVKRVAHGFTWDRADLFVDEMLCERRPEAYRPLVDRGLVPPPPRTYRD